jgi:serine/threonine-protein kinase
MPAEAFRRLQAVFDAALAQPPPAREAFVRDACADAPALADAVLALLSHDARLDGTDTVRAEAPAAEAFAALGMRRPGTRFGPFAIEAEIATGGMGRVFRARRVDGEVEQVVALKIVRRELLDDALLTRFSAERRILAALSHPGIAHLIDAGTEADGTPYVAMEYVDGVSLPAHCARHALPLRARIALFRQVLDAVAHAHRQLVLHRDLKPDNVLVAADGRTKLLDFGIARVLAPDDARTATAERFFTPAYAAPELVSGAHAGVPADVYALGALLYELLTGVAPFVSADATPAERERRILHVPPAPMRGVVLARDRAACAAAGIDDPARWARQLGGDLERIVQKALRKEPAARYASVERFDDDLARFLERRPVHATGGGRAYRLRRFLVRHAWSVGAAAVVAVVLLAGIAHTVVQNRAIRDERDRAQAALAVLREAFRATDPLQPEAGDLRARDVLASAARAVAPLERQRPALFRDLAWQIGEIEMNLGQDAAALDLVMRANRVLPAPSDAGRLLELRGLVLAGRLAEARRQLDAARPRLGASPAFAAVEGHLLTREHREPEAIALLQRWLSPTGLGADAPPVLRDRVFLQLAEAERLADRPDRAMAVLDRLLAEQRRRDGDAHPRVLATRMRRAGLLTARDVAGAVEAERELRAMQSLVEREYDRASAAQGTYRHLLGQALNAQNRRLDALAEYRRALESDEAALGPLHENTLRDQLNVAIAIAYGAQDRREAYVHFDAAIAGLERLRGPGDSLVGFARLEAAKAHFWDGDAAAARRVLAPPNALRFFPAMPAGNRREYLDALAYGFGRPDCAAMPAATDEAPAAIARRLLCLHAPAAAGRPKS